ncbi:MAG: hypothetical protein EBE86_009225 [Hormoscilla sp. GUM202]|nr:hypothetical protein [Hormoscilla sp. GUM202]
MKQETLNGKLAKLVEKYGYKAVWQTLTEIKEISPDEILSSREDIKNQKQSVSNNLNENGEDSPDAIAFSFASLASQWSQAVAGMSSTVEMAKHPAYREIISMGEAVIPFLLGVAGDRERWWQPTPSDEFYWVEGVPRSETLSAYIQAYQTLGYTSCESEVLEIGYEKIALYVDDRGVPVHAAKQLPNVKWSSKLGWLEDIEHELEGLIGERYGKVGQILKRVSQT